MSGLAYNLPPSLQQTNPENYHCGVYAPRRYVLKCFYVVRLCVHTNLKFELTYERKRLFRPALLTYLPPMSLLTIQHMPVTLTIIVSCYIFNYDCWFNCFVQKYGLELKCYKEWSHPDLVPHHMPHQHWKRCCVDKKYGVNEATYKLLTIKCWCYI